MTAWLNLLGLVTVLGAINVGTWTFFVGAFGPALGIENTLTNQMIFLVVITGAQALINHIGIGLTAKLTDFSGYLIFATRSLIAVVCLVCAPSTGISRGCSPSRTTPAMPAAASGRGLESRWVFPLGLLLPIYTITGYDASAHTSEETHQGAPTRCRARMVMSVVWSARVRLPVPVPPSC